MIDEQEKERREELLRNVSKDGIREALDKELEISKENKKFFEKKIAYIEETLRELFEKDHTLV